MVLADAEFDSERNYQHIREGLQAQMRQDFPAYLYGRRSLIESLISAVKRKLSVCAPRRSLQPQYL